MSRLCDCCNRRPATPDLCDHFEVHCPAGPRKGNFDRECHSDLPGHAIKKGLGYVKAFASSEHLHKADLCKVIVSQGAICNVLCYCCRPCNILQSRYGDLWLLELSLWLWKCLSDSIRRIGAHVACEKLWDTTLCILDKCCNIKREAIEDEFQRYLGDKNPCIDMKELANKLQKLRLTVILNTNLG